MRRVPVKILVCAGGTGGGIYPALAAVNRLRDSGVKNEEILWIGIEGEMEEEIIPRAGIQMETIQGGAIVGVPLTTTVKNGMKLARSVQLSSNIISRFHQSVSF